MSFRKILHLFHSFEHEWNKMSSIRLEWKITRLPVTYTSIAFIFKKFSETKNIFLLRYYFLMCTFSFLCYFTTYPSYLSLRYSVVDRWNKVKAKCIHSNLDARKYKERKKYELISRLTWYRFIPLLLRILSAVCRFVAKDHLHRSRGEISSRVVKPSPFLRRGEHTLKCFFDTGHEDKKRA